MMMKAEMIFPTNVKSTMRSFFVIAAPNADKQREAEYTSLITTTPFDSGK